MNAFRIFGTLAFGFAAALRASTAFAASDAPSAPFVPEKFLIGRGPAESSASGIEKPQVLDGSTYTIVTPIFTGQDNNNSFLRFPNYDANTATNLVTVVGTVSGTVYGTAAISAAQYASPQVPISQILTLANVTSTTNSTHETVSLYIKNPSLTAAYQHVIFNATSGFFENMSACTYVNGKNYRYLAQTVSNAHTTSLTGYSSYITVHNPTNASLYFQLDVYNAATGLYVGTYSQMAVANGTYAIPMESVQAQAGWSPSPTDLHANIVAKSPLTTNTTLPVVGQYIYNATLKTYVNMSTVCPLNFGNL